MAAHRDGYPRLCAYYRRRCRGVLFRRCPLCRKALCPACYRGREFRFNGRCGRLCLRWILSEAAEEGIQTQPPTEWGAARSGQ